MFVTIEEITAYGNSKHFSGGTIGVKFQGLCQGNGAAPTGCAVISITILKAHKKKEHGAYFTCSISLLKMHLAGILFVDDTDLIYLNMDHDESMYEAHKAIQLSIMNWGQLLMTSGGSLKPIKIFYHLIHFEWRSNGTWKNVRNDLNKEFDISVPLPSVQMVSIAYLLVGESKETLGVHWIVEWLGYGQLTRGSWVRFPLGSLPTIASATVAIG